jgi:hypothetical protein
LAIDPNGDAREEYRLELSGDVDGRKAETKYETGRDNKRIIWKLRYCLAPAAYTAHGILACCVGKNGV